MTRSDNVRARDITWRELKARLDEGRDVALLPVGSMEMHGPQMPLGTDTYVAEAVALLAARKMRGTLFDTITYTWPGMTKHSRGTISLTMDMEKQYARAVCDELRRNGFGRIYVIQFHGPGHALTQMVREFTEENCAPIAFYPLMTLPPYREMFQGTDAQAESSLAVAAARMLGADPQIDPETPIVRQPMPGAEARQAVFASGARVGALAFHESHHAPPAAPLDLELAEKALEAMADLIAGTADAMTQWRDAWRGLTPGSVWREE